MRILALLLTLVFTSAQAHEFWLSPLDYAVPVGAPVVADIRVGENFSGSAYVWLGRNVAASALVQGETVKAARSRLGDLPALHYGDLEEGLAVLVHASRHTRLVYDSWEEFAKFASEVDETWAIAAHEARGLSRDEVTEGFARYAKSLVAVGDGAGADRFFGMPMEIVALANPYTDALPDGLLVQVLREGEPFGDKQLQIFSRSSSGEVLSSTVRTDAEGGAIVPLRPGAEYLLSSVLLREAPELVAGSLSVAWESQWASLTFRVPEL